MNDLQQKILETAWWWKTRSCRETIVKGRGTNGGSCIDDVQRQFGPVFRREAYCAKFAWVVVQAACDAVGITNILPHEAGAITMLHKAQTVPGLRIDTTPVPGCVFYRRSTAKGATGHIGIVYQIDDPKAMWTVEGNNKDRIDLFHTSWPYVRDPQNKFSFIHTEEMGGPGAEIVSSAGFGIIPILLILGAGFGIYRYARS